MSTQDREALDIDEIVFADFAVRQGCAFNPLSSLTVKSEAKLIDPPGGADAPSQFGHSVQWLGANVGLGEQLVAHHTINSDSGFDCDLHTDVPAPASWSRLGLALGLKLQAGRLLAPYQLLDANLGRGSVPATA